MPGKIHPKLRVAAVQAAPAYLKLDAAIDKTVLLMKEAALQDVKLIAFPETWIPGYPWRIWLGSPAAGMQFVERYHDNSLVLVKTRRELKPLQRGLQGRRIQPALRRAGRGAGAVRS